ncbi:hypothetical protein LTR94_020854 [Friedmanniomyces endolithicus]|nr:hypothetical protein LTR94_020854 [Friedmanniomyces endolithicus]
MALATISRSNGSRVQAKRQAASATAAIEASDWTNPICSSSVAIMAGTDGGLMRPSSVRISNSTITSGEIIGAFVRRSSFCAASPRLRILRR